MSNLTKRRGVSSSPVRYEVHGDMVALQVDYSTAPVPEHYYVADFFNVELVGADVLFVFGKKDSPKNDRLRNKIEVFFPGNVFLLQLWASSRDFHRTLAKFISESGIEPAKPDLTVEHPSGMQVRTLHSNNVLMAHSGGETIADFFYISPKEVWVRPRRGEEIVLEAVVRVMLQPALLVGLLDVCGGMIDTVKQRVHPILLHNPEGGSHEEAMELRNA